MAEIRYLITTSVAQMDRIDELARKAAGFPKYPGGVYDPDIHPSLVTWGHRSTYQLWSEGWPPYTTGLYMAVIDQESIDGLADNGNNGRLTQAEATELTSYVGQSHQFDGLPALE
jgi:hypothetical protein